MLSKLTTALAVLIGALVLAACGTSRPRRGVTRRAS
jgi:hypothetical protein